MISSLSQAEPFFVVRDALGDMRLILDGGNAGAQGWRIDVERAAQPVDGVDHRRRARAPAKAERRETVDFREGPRHHHVLARAGEFEARLVIGAGDEFGIGGVEDQQNMRRQGIRKPRDLRRRQIGAGRVVRIGEEDDLRLRRHFREDGVDIGGKFNLVGDDRRAARRQNGDAIERKAMFGIDAFIAQAQEGIGQQKDQFVRARAADDLRRVEPMQRAERRAQGASRAVGIDREALGG